MEELKMPPYCNASLRDNYKKHNCMLMPIDFKGSFAYWVASQNPNKDVKVIDLALEAWTNYISTEFQNPEVPQLFHYGKLNRIISEEVFGAIPEIRALNEMKPDFIDLYALARNIFYMIVRESVMEKKKLI